MKHFFTAALLGLVILFGLEANTSYAEDLKVGSEEFGISISLPADRWKPGSKYKPGEYTEFGHTYWWAFLDDRQKEASFEVWVYPKVSDDGKETVAMNEWLDEVIYPYFFKGYTEGRKYEIKDERTEAIILPSGQEANARYLTLVINGNWRNVVMLSLELDGKYIWICARNVGKSKDLQAVFPEVVSAINLG